MAQSALLFLGLVLLCGAGALATIAPDNWFHPESTASTRLHESHQHHITRNMTRSDRKIPLDFYVMSKCPDAQVCITAYQAAVTAISSIADVTVNYIASYDGNSFTCMHGPTECAGDLQQICAENLFPNITSSGSIPWFDFMACQEHTRPKIPDNGQSCAQTAGLDWNTLNTCATTTQGVNFLVTSIARTNAAQETVSCTVNVDNAFWCQHNGDWVNCNEGTSSNDLITAICKRYTGPDKPQACP